MVNLRSSRIIGHGTIELNFDISIPSWILVLEPGKQGHETSTGITCISTSSHLQVKSSNYRKEESERKPKSEFRERERERETAEDASEVTDDGMGWKQH